MQAGCRDGHVHDELEVRASTRTLNFRAPHTRRSATSTTSHQYYGCSSNNHCRDDILHPINHPCINLNPALHHVPIASTCPFRPEVVRNRNLVHASRLAHSPLSRCRNHSPARSRRSSDRSSNSTRASFTRRVGVNCRTGYTAADPARPESCRADLEEAPHTWRHPSDEGPDPQLSGPGRRSLRPLQGSPPQ